jgi:lipopolysaccharide export LptBFGC system permease protein LptF
MVVSTLAVGDLITAIPALYESLRVPLAVIALIVGAVAGAFGLARGFGSAAGKVVGGIAIAVLIFGGLGIALSVKATVDRHGGGITTGQFGQ